MKKLTDVFPTDASVVLADGNTYTMSELNLNAQALIEEKYGIQLMETYPDPADPDNPDRRRNGLEIFLNDKLGSPAQWRFAAWALMRRDHRSLTEETLGFLITPKNQEATYKLVTKQIIASFPMPDDQKKDLEEMVDTAKVSIGSAS